VTTLRQNTVFQAVEDRDVYVGGGMERGIRASMRQLDDLVTELGKEVPSSRCSTERTRSCTALEARSEALSPKPSQPKGDRRRRRQLRKSIAR